MVDLNDMLVFAKVAEMEGISAAARALQMPKSRVSRRMAVLEAALGVRLLERSTRAVHLTEQGKIYYQHCIRIAEEAHSAVESVQQMLDMPRGHLRLSTSVSIGQNLIAPYLSEFIQQYPEIEIEIDLTNRRVDMITEGFDLVIRVGKLQDSSLVSRRLGSGKAHLYASPGYLEQAAPIHKLADLTEHRTLKMSDTSFGARWVLEDENGQQQSVSINSAVSINDYNMLRSVAEADGGISLMPNFLVGESLKSGRLQCLLPQWSTPAFNYYAVYPSHQGILLLSWPLTSNSKELRQ